MTAAPTPAPTAPPVEILDLRHFSARQLRPLLEQEAEVWRKRLHWDYRSSTELLLQYLDSRILPGFVALHRGRICGYCFCVYEGRKAVIGDLYTASDVSAPLAITHTLARHLLELLEASPEVTRIEAQLLLFDPGVLPSAFAAEGASVFSRLFLERDLRSANTLAPPFAPDIELSAWKPGAYQAAAELIQAAYAGHIDSQINDQYRTLEGSLRFLHNVVRFPGCGTFDPESSWTLRERRSNQLVGLLLCSRIASGTAHVTQLCIAPALRGRSLGKLLLDVCLRELPARGYDTLSLTVSEANDPAVRFYLRAGFYIHHRFDAFVLEKTDRPTRLRLRLDTLNGSTAAAATRSSASKPSTPARR